MTGQLPRVFALTICAYRLPGMDEEAYHRYTSEKHALLVKELLIKKRILGYTMTHNTTGTRQMMNQIFGDFPETGMADFDCLIQITFRDVQDYIDVRQDPVYREVISPDHGNFADLARTKMVIGWLETHMADGKLL